MDPVHLYEECATGSCYLNTVKLTSETGGGYCIYTHGLTKTSREMLRIKKKVIKDARKTFKTESRAASFKQCSSNIRFLAIALLDLP